MVVAVIATISIEIIVVRLFICEMNVTFMDVIDNVCDVHTPYV